MFYLLLSFVLINVVHGYGIYANKGKIQNTISENFALEPQLLIFYRLAHTLNGLLLIAIVCATSSLREHLLIILLAIFSLFFEWAQAVIPYKNKLKQFHNFFAISMAASMVALGWSIQLLVMPSGVSRVVASLAGIVALVSFVYIKNPPRPKSWVIQMITINAIYLQVAVSILNN